MQRELSAQLTEGLICKDYPLFTIPPSFSQENATSLYTREAYGVTCLRVASNSCMAGRPTSKRTCASPVTIRAMPENEKPPAMRVDIYCITKTPPLWRGSV